MRPVTRRIWLVLAVLVLLALVWFAPGDEDGLAAPALDKTGRSRKAVAVRSRPTKTTVTPVGAADASHGQLISQGRAPVAENIPDLFAGVSWYLPPPPPPPAPPPPPSAPPLPFVYLGQYIEGDKQLILLTRGVRMISVSVGDVMDKTYKVVSMQGGQLTFLYLPLNVEQSLDTGTNQ